MPSNSSAFPVDPLADLDVWRETADDSELVYRMTVDGGPDGRSNTRYMCDLNLVDRLLHILQESSSQQLGGSTRETMWNVLSWLPTRSTFCN